MAKRPRLSRSRPTTATRSSWPTCKARPSCSTSTRATTRPAAPRKPARFRDRQAELAKLGAKVLGVSTDDVTSHEKFRDKFKLNFPLLADADHAVAEKYGAWREKNMYGKKSMGIQRTTFLIDAAGNRPPRSGSACKSTATTRKCWRR